MPDYQGIPTMVCVEVRSAIRTLLSYKCSHSSHSGSGYNNRADCLMQASSGGAQYPVAAGHYI
jgi:hypothetical protein